MKPAEQRRLIKSVKEYINNNRELLNNVVDVELGFKRTNDTLTNEICIRFIVNRKLDNSQIKKDNAITMLPKTLLGYKTDVLSYDKGEDENGYGQRFNPLPGSTAIVNALIKLNYGTLTCILTDANNTPYGVSCYHVIMGRQGNAVGGAILQPLTNNISNIIGQANLFTCRVNAEADCVAFPLANRQALSRIYPFNEPLFKIRIPAVNEPVKKSGITTGVTYGRVESVSLDYSKVSIGVNPGKPNSGKLTDGGDSGALWVLDDSSPYLQGIAMHTRRSSEKENISFATSLKYITETFKLKIV